MTGEPDFTPAARSRPQLTPVEPVTTQLLQIVKTEGGFDDLDFLVKLRSEDAGDEVSAVLLINYGIPSNAGEPWEDDTGRRIYPPGTLADGPRDITLKWLPALSLNKTSDCKSVTMLVTHETVNQDPYRSCPKDLDADTATLTWFVSMCEQPLGCTFADCKQLFDPPEGGFTYCPDDWQSALENL